MAITKRNYGDFAHIAMSGPRSRNCYKLATQYNLAALRVARELRWARKDDARSLWDSRLEGVRI